MRNKKIPKTFYYLMMNKIAGEVCSTVSDSHETVYSHFPSGLKIHSIGRLDCDAEGLLLFTNDGKLSNFLTRPENKVPKKYLVELKYCVNQDVQRRYAKEAKNGVILPSEKKAGEQKSGGAEIEWISGEKCHITLTEGKFHEVKRIFRSLGNEVLYLKRVSFASLELDENLSGGQWRELSCDEKNALLSLFRIPVCERFSSSRT